MRIRLAYAAGLLLCMPVTVLALGLGPMQTNSSLNEPFEAKIPLVDAKVDQLDTLKARLANRAQFKRAGLDYALTLSDLRFELVQPKAGSDYIRIWSKEPVREPVLDFLLEVNWSSGRLIREFTVLLDPPRYEATSSAAPPPREATVAPRPQPGPSSPATMSSGGTSADQYGPTRAGDTLWDIAQGVRTGEVSVQQMMLALLQANPNAFINANINHLKQGQILRIPEAGVLSAPTQAEALAEVRRHNALWEEYRQRIASSVPERSLGAEGSQGTALGSEEKPPAAAEKARLEVVGAVASPVGNAQEGAAADKGQQGEEAQRLVAEESQAATEDENSHLRQRLKESEDLAELMRRQMQLKDDQLAALQAKLAEAGPAVSEAVQEPSGVAIAEQPGSAAPQAAAAETAVQAGEPQGTETLVPTESRATKPLVEVGPAATPSSESPETVVPSPADETALNAGAATEPLPAQPGGQAQPAAEPSAAPSILDSQESAETASPNAVQAPAASTEPGSGLADAAPPANQTQQEGAAVAAPTPGEDAGLIPGGIYSAIGLIAVAGMFVFWVFWRMRAKSQGAEDEDELTEEAPFQPGGVRGFAAAGPGQDEEAPVVERTLEDLHKHAQDVEAELEEEGDRTRFPTELAGEKDPLFAQQSEEDDRRWHDETDAQREVLDITSVRGGEPWKSENGSKRAELGMASSALDFDLGTTQEKEPATPISARGGSIQEAGEYTDVFDLSSPEDAASEGIVDVTAVGEDNGDPGQMFDLGRAETTSGAEDVLDLTAVDSQSGMDPEMLDLTVADNATTADEMLDLTTTAGSGYEGDGLEEGDGLDFDITEGYELPETTGEPEEALHLTVPKASFPSAKPPEPQEQVFEITHPTEKSGARDRSLEIGQETVELPQKNTLAETAEQEDEGIQTVDLFHYFRKEDGRSAGNNADQPDAAQSSVQGGVPEAADSDPFGLSVDHEPSGDAETDLGRSYPGVQALTESAEEATEAAENELNSWEATGGETEWCGGDTADVTSLSEHRSQQSARQNHAVFVEGETSEEQAPWSAYRDSAQRLHDEASTPSEEVEEAEAGHEPSLATSEQVGSTPGEEPLKAENVEQSVTLSNTDQLPQDTLTPRSGPDSAAEKNDFVVIADLTAPEEVVLIDLTDSEKTQEIGDIQQSDRFAHTVRLPRAFPAATGEQSDLDSKLNLAKAFIELGDPKGAREILDEIAQSGSDGQKQDAETLRRQLG